MHENFVHLFYFVSYRSKQDIWAPKRHLLGEPKTLNFAHNYYKLVVLCNVRN